MTNDLEGITHSRGWNEYEMYVVNQLQTLNTDLKELKASVNSLTLSHHGTRKDVSNLKKITKTNGLRWGSVAGFFAAIVAALLKHFVIKE